LVFERFNIFNCVSILRFSSPTSVTLVFERFNILNCVNP
jgi:hypothetical protein